MDAKTENQTAGKPAKRAAIRGPEQGRDEGSFEAQRRKRLEQAGLNEALARKRCAGCATLGAWTVYNIEKAKGRTRYIKCRACGYCGQVTVIIKENGDDKAQQGQG